MGNVKYDIGIMNEPFLHTIWELSLQVTYKPCMCIVRNYVEYVRCLRYAFNIQDVSVVGCTPSSGGWFSLYRYFYWTGGEQKY